MIYNLKLRIKPRLGQNPEVAREEIEGVLHNIQGYHIIVSEIGVEPLGEIPKPLVPRYTILSTDPQKPLGE